MDLNGLRDAAYKAAVRHGFHGVEHNNEEHLRMLVITEVAEMVEADRNGRRAGMEAFNGHVGAGMTFKKAFMACIKDTLEDEMADVVIRLLDFAGTRGLDLATPTCICFDSVLRRRGFTENAFYFCRMVCEKDTGIGILIKYMEEWAGVLGIDIEEHVRLKMVYNDMRPKLNGKKY